MAEYIEREAAIKIVNTPNYNKHDMLFALKTIPAASAADAIEELSMKLHGDEAAIAGMKREIERMVVSGNKPRWMGTTLAGVLAGYDKVPTRRKQRARRRAGRYDWRLRIFTEETAPRQRATIMGMR